MRVKTKIGWIQYEASFDTDSIQSRDHHDKSDFEKEEDGFLCNFHAIYCDGQLL